jgi:hypothetical protein
VSFIPRSLYPRGKTPNLICLGGPQNLCGRGKEEKNLCFYQEGDQPVAKYYAE